MSISFKHKIGCFSEQERAAFVLMHDPSDELFFSSLHPLAALFEDCPHPRLAALEHQRYQQLLTQCGVDVVTVKQVLFHGTVDQHDNVLQSPETTALRELAKRFLTFRCGSDVSSTEQEQYRNEVLQKMHPVELVQVILTNPTVVLSATKTNTLVTAEYVVSPLLNLYFTRDQMVTTPRGVVLGRMNSPQREKEVQLMSFCLNKLGVVPVHTVTGDTAYLEGGDYLPMGEVAFIGCGMRTTLPAITQMMEQDVFGCHTVVVVNDTRWWQQQMHLDTYFNVIDKDLCIFSEERLTDDDKSPNYVACDVYEQDKATRKYVLKRQAVPFVKFVSTELRMTIIPISVDDSNTYACNFITIGPREIVAVAGQSQHCKDNFEKHQVKVHWAKLSNLTMGYGAAHCMTQILARSSKK